MWFEISNIPATFTDGYPTLSYMIVNDYNMVQNNGRVPDDESSVISMNLGCFSHIQGYYKGFLTFHTK